MKTPALTISHVTAGILLLLAPVAAAGAVPVPVSPGGPAGGLAKDTCPAFSWSQGERGGPYELVVYPVTADGDLGPEPALAARLPAGAQSWTPSADRCLRAGGRYAWTLREIGAGADDEWSEPALFRVSAAPSIQQVEAAMETLRRHLVERQVDGGSPHPAAEVLGPLAAARDRRSGGGESHTGRVEASADAGIARDGAGAPAHIALADAPVLGSPSLTVRSDIALGAASNLFKEGAVFLWDDTSNTALGRNALASATGRASGNTAVGRHALENTTEGEAQIEGSNNTAIGFEALVSNTTGRRNTASGFKALYYNITGANNTASGFYALAFNTSGSRNIAVGRYAGLYANGNDNIFLGSGAHGLSSDTRTTRIGGRQDRTFIGGIHGVTTGLQDAIPVVIDFAGQLGTMSSSRALKQEIQEIGELSERLLELRPVAFRYKVHAEADPETPLQFGLIAEEVAEIFPELVIYDEDGDPETVKYHLLASLLLNELQQEHARLDNQGRQLLEQGRDLAELSALRERVAALEASELRPAQKRTPWWRHLRAMSAHDPAPETDPTDGDRP